MRLATVFLLCKYTSSLPEHIVNIGFKFNIPLYYSNLIFKVLNIPLLIIVLFRLLQLVWYFAIFSNLTKYRYR